MKQERKRNVRKGSCIYRRRPHSLWSYGGTLKDIISSKLASIGIKGLLEKTKINERAHVDSVFLDSSLHCSTALNPARCAALDSGLGYNVSASYVEMQCGSAIDTTRAYRLAACAA